MRDRALRTQSLHRPKTSRGERHPLTATELAPRQKQIQLPQRLKCCRYTYVNRNENACLTTARQRSKKQPAPYTQATELKGQKVCADPKALGLACDKSDRNPSKAHSVSLMYFWDFEICALSCLAKLYILQAHGKLTRRDSPRPTSSLLSWLQLPPSKIRSV